MSAANTVRALPLDRVRLLDGPCRRLQELHRLGLVGQLDPDRLLVPFRRQAGLAQPPSLVSYGGWDEGFISGHFAGHYLTAAARMYAATGDASFRAKAEAVVEGLSACQKRLGGGYLSAFAETRLDRLESEPHNGSVDYYTLHKILAGLVDVARHCANDLALAMASRLSDYIARRMARLSAETIEAMCRTDYTANPHNEFGGLAEGLADLCLLARERGQADADRHLSLALLFCRDWFIEPLLAGEDRLAGLRGNTHIAQACGLARCAAAGADPRLGQAAARLWHLVADRRTFANGGNTFDEKLRSAGVEVAGAGDEALGPLTSEYCNTNNMLKLTRALFEREPAAALGDYYENALYNHIMAAISPDTGQVVYHMSMRPGDYRQHIAEPYCCLGTGIENAARFGEAIYFQSADALWVNLYVTSTVDWREQGLSLRLDTRYPEDGQVRLSVGAGGPVAATVHLRVPGWATEPVAVRVNGQAVASGAPGTFVGLSRTWRAGDVAELDLPLGLRQRPSRDDPGTVSFYHGPLLLAGALGRRGMPDSDVGSNVALKDAPAWPVPALVPASIEADGPTTYRAMGIEPSGKTAEVILAPLYDVHHQRYAVYWKLAAPPAG